MSRSFSMMLWAIVALYAALILLSPLGVIPGSLNAPLNVLLPMAFALLHGSKQYRLRDMLIFSAICLAVSNAFENLSILTGFPFGHYHYNVDFRPKLFLVPILIGLAYLGMGYLSWTLARLILDGKRLRRDRLVAVPLIASFVMVSWDLTLDPVASTLGRSWIWHDGGSYFGVPVSNFLGWYLTVYVFFQLFAFYLDRSRTPPRRNAIPARQSSWWPAWAMVAATAFRPISTLLFRPPGSPTVIDPAGVTWNVAAIYGACALAAVFAMGPFLALGLIRLTERRPER
jgi:putative membrane protein